eukprot:CAMPEP_0202961124 /NCGR_PEP_ID=MMETSP1396-20130829/5193_1 /ASSEMBLY_ACC=CAM_ASM_000872 /TAXON_ID= /ORGANISM="Pseudokeronopsis sp., Strain Brazil" /LENGTH=45 /DNA_ID= /DNA_START= /DNA_END= /DNA_ORIENTATION=
MVKCPQEGCESPAMKYGKLVDHLEKECDAVRIDCPMGCNASFQKK